MSSDSGVTRRSFLAGAAAIGATTAAVALGREPLARAYDRMYVDFDPHGTGTDTDDYGADQVIYSVCQQCQTFCSIKAVLFPGGETGATAQVRKIAGNPYSPLSTQPYGPIAYGTPVAEAARGIGQMARESFSRRGGRTCLKGQAGIQVAFDRMRITQPLKRVGPRGSGQWQTVSWDQALNEILDGAPDLGTPGLRQIWAYVPEKPVMADWEQVKQGQMSQEAFDAKYKDALIDTRHPDFGPRANQVAFLGGDRGALILDRLVARSLGSRNYFNHAGVCGIQGVIANVRSHTPQKTKKRMYADLDHAQYLIVWGTEPLLANKGPTWLAPRIMNAVQRGMKLVVVDPRMSKTAEKAHRWLPVLPGADAALALGLARCIIEQGRYDQRYLRAPGPAAAKAAGEPTWSDATHLVNLSDPRRPKVRLKDLGLAGDGAAGDGLAVLRDGAVGANTAPEPADLEVEATLETPKGPIQVKSVFTLLRERVLERSLDQYAELCGIDPQTIADVAREFTAHGKRAVVMSYRGPAMHGNGFYNVRAINVLNFLIGNHDWKGGEISAGAKYAEQKGARYDLTQVPGAKVAWGIPITREKSRYEQSSLFAGEGYPARRRWYPLGANLCQEVVPSAVDAYPYPLKALFIHRHSPVTSSANGAEQARGLADTRAIPLLVAFDVVLGESSQYADYILPDVSYLERWGLESIYPNQPYKVSQLAQPVTRIFPGPRPAEDVYIDLFKAMGLPGVGDNAFAEGRSLDSAGDWYLKIAANIAFDGTPVPDADAGELALFTAARQQALGPDWQAEDWQRAVTPEEWPKVVYVLSRGGRFEPPGQEYEGEWIKYRFGAECVFYDEASAAVKDSYSGQFYDGLPRYEPVRHFDGTVADDPLPLVLINWKSRHQGTHRTAGAAWLREIQGSNPLWMNPRDAAARGLTHGDRVRIRSATHAVEGAVLLTEGIRPGVVGAEFSYGHTQYGSRPVQIDGAAVAPVQGYGHTPFALAPLGHEESGYAADRGQGFLVNHVIRTDAVLKGSPITDPLAGGTAQLDTRVEVEKA